MLPELDLKKIKQLLDNAESQIREAKGLIFGPIVGKTQFDSNEGEKEVTEGVFDGEKMLDINSKTHLVPANYASKSKLVVGDAMKLTILADGTFIYKQTGPVPRRKLVGVVKDCADGKFEVDTLEGKYRVLPASISYFKATAGDKVSISIPESGVSEWAAIENVLI
jgi:hypothetical protein